MKLTHRGPQDYQSLFMYRDAVRMIQSDLPSMTQTLPQLLCKFLGIRSAQVLMCRSMLHFSIRVLVAASAFALAGWLIGGKEASITLFFLCLAFIAIGMIASLIITLPNIDGSITLSHDFRHPKAQCQLHFPQVGLASKDLGHIVKLIAGGSKFAIDKGLDHILLRSVLIGKCSTRAGVVRRLNNQFRSLNIPCEAIDEGEGTWFSGDLSFHLGYLLWARMCRRPAIKTSSFRRCGNSFVWGRIVISRICYLP